MHQPGNGIRGTGSGPHPDGDGVRKPKRPQHAGDIGEDLEARRTGSTLAPRMKKIAYPPLRTQSRNPQGNEKPLDKTRRRQKKEEPKRHRTLNLKATDNFSVLWVDVRTRSDRASVRTSRLFQAAGRKGFPSTKNSKPLGASIKRNPQVPREGSHPSAECAKVPESDISRGVGLSSLREVASDMRPVWLERVWPSVVRGKFLGTEFQRMESCHSRPCVHHKIVAQS